MKYLNAFRMCALVSPLLINGCGGDSAGTTSATAINSVGPFTPQMGLLRVGSGASLGNIEAVSAASNYQSPFFTATNSALSTNASAQYFLRDYLNDGNLDLIEVITENTLSANVEINIFSGASGFQTNILAAKTSIPEFVDTSYQVEFADWDGDGIADLAVIHKRNTASGFVEVTFYSGSSQFQTALETAPIVSSFASIGDEGEFHFTKANTNSVTTLGYTSFIETGADSLPDLALIKKYSPASGNPGGCSPSTGADNGSCTTEVHILSGSTHFQNAIVHTSTNLYELTASQSPGFSFSFGDYNGDGVTDLILIKQTNTPGTAEVHVYNGVEAAVAATLVVSPSLTINIPAAQVGTIGYFQSALEHTTTLFPEDQSTHFVFVP